MEVKRTIKVNTDQFEVGDVIKFKLADGEKVQARAVKQTSIGMLFVLVDCLAKEYPMFESMEDMTEDYFTYDNSDLRKALNGEILARFPEEIRSRMVALNGHGDLLRIPTEREIFGENVYGQPDDEKRWKCMKKRRNRIAFQGKDFNPLFETTEITNEERLELDKVFSLIHDTHFSLTDNLKEKAVAKKLYTETHLISLVPYFAKAVEDGIDADMMADWLVDFFGSHSEEYDIAAGNGSAKNSNIVTRDKVLSESFEQFFTEE